eukprot:TRINITY_DN12316_c0_g1_i1.p1 TRINITY_DN12316_c0_g1~~TRINITY_DN12316_c0_g1_i1.p1  ORF type:complete len:114 (-),score=23.46 TRINITY_DN12316_c0_g1_i1:496-837(-)
MVYKKLDGGQMGPTPPGSTSPGAVHGSTSRSMVQIIHPVGHMIPQLLSTKTGFDNLELENPNSDSDLLLIFVKIKMGMVPKALIYITTKICKDAKLWVKILSPICDIHKSTVT